jgi:hypothetical protein
MGARAFFSFIDYKPAPGREQQVLSDLPGGGLIPARK